MAQISCFESSVSIRLASLRIRERPPVVYTCPMQKQLSSYLRFKTSRIGGINSDAGKKEFIRWPAGESCDQTTPSVPLSAGNIPDLFVVVMEIARCNTFAFREAAFTSKIEIRARMIVPGV